MNKISTVIFSAIAVGSIILWPGGAVAQGQAGGDFPRYLPPAQTRDEIIQEEQRRQEEELDRNSPASVVWFVPGGDKVKPEYKKAIAGLAQYLDSHPGATVTLNGYTDNLGTPEAGRRLSERRARKVKAILVEEFGIDKSRIKAVGRGRANPIASNRTAAGRQKNNRVEAVIE